MIISNSKKYRDDFVAVANFIETYEGKINYYDLIRFVATFEYFKVYYQNYYIFKDLIVYHDSNLEVKHSDDFQDDDNLDDMLKF